VAQKVFSEGHISLNDEHEPAAKSPWKRHASCQFSQRLIRIGVKRCGSLPKSLMWA
jgi:hypothetical protein